MKDDLTYIDIFAGCGGLSLGLFKSGWQGLFAIERSEMAFETLKFNLIDIHKHFSWPNWLPVKNYDINYFLKKFQSNLLELNGKVDLVVGGPPCQGFSMAGRRDESDQRNKLIKSYIKFIKLVNPKMLLFENVKGFNIGFKKGNKRGEPYSKYVLDTLRQLGYNVKGKIVTFSEFGVPQKRQRFIIFGIKDDDPEQFFELLTSNSSQFLKEKNLSRKVTIADAISDLNKSNGVIDSLDTKGFKAGTYSQAKSSFQKLMRSGSTLKIPDSHRFSNHQESTIKKFKTILRNSEKNKTVNESIRRKYSMKKHSVIPLAENTCSPTLTTLPDDYIHYSEPRILTVREYARIQSFPDWFEFKSKYTSGGKLRKKEVPRYTQIGNAIPPLFGEITGQILIELLSKSKQSNFSQEITIDAIEVNT